MVCATSRARAAPRCAVTIARWLRNDRSVSRSPTDLHKEERGGPFAWNICSASDSACQAQRLLTDAGKTAVFFVTLPEALPIAVITRFIGWFQEFGIPGGGVQRDTSSSGLGVNFRLFATSGAMRSSRPTRTHIEYAELVESLNAVSAEQLAVLTSKPESFPAGQVRTCHRHLLLWWRLLDLSRHRS